jgi:predicted glycosyltransferase
MLQIPKILEAINKENDWLDHAIEAHRINAVISDNRYGLYSDRVPTVFMTHQLRIQTSLGEKADNFLQKFNYHFVEEFGACWVPDTDDFFNLSGALSHPERMPSIPVSYLGPLTRFTPSEDKNSDKHLLVLLSGPEPQRTLLENLLLTQLQTYSKPVMVVRGLPGNEAHPIPALPPHFTIMDHLPAKELEVAIQDASFVIGRCGYSTVMDLMALQKKSILIPTPGQTEQEYLSVHLMEKGMAFCLPQEGLDIKMALGIANEYVYAFPEYNSDPSLTQAVSQLKLQTRQSKEVVS